MTRIEALLSARLWLAPQRVGERLYFISDLSGRLSLYVMDVGGSVPEPLLPPDLALQNPHHMGGKPFAVLPHLGKIIVMLDRDGDENYQPMWIPLEGGFPEPAFGDRFTGMQVDLAHVDEERNVTYLEVDARTEALITLYQANLQSGELRELGRGVHGPHFGALSADGSQVLTGENYNIGDGMLLLQPTDSNERRVVFGTPLDQRGADFVVQNHDIQYVKFVPNSQYALVSTMVFDDCYGLALLALDGSQQIEPISITGAVHTGAGELDHLEQIAGERYVVGYNIDGCSWRYEATFDLAGRTMHLRSVLCGVGELGNGVLESMHHDGASDSYALSFSTATTPTQIYTLEGANRDLRRHTRERILGLPAAHLSPGEDASFTSHDGLRISARLYRPAPALSFDGPRPLVYYIHGGPQSQERPDFAWFSMPLIQFLTLNGFAVFVPNVRGSSGYGFAYMDEVTHDWGGQDRLDHVHAMTEILPHDERIDVRRAGVMGRSYGGYMTLTLAGRHPELWSAAIDMFGPYDLFTFSERIPETWKPYMAQMVGDPATEPEFVRERSPRTYINNVRCPLLVLQGANDPRVIERESAELVAELRELGKQVEYLPFADEGHDVLKFVNKVRCYNAITDFFKQHLGYMG